MTRLGWPEIVRGDNDQLFATDGRVFTDLFSAHGAVLLGHRCPPILEAVSKQLDSLWLTGGLPTPSQRQAAATIETFFPGDYRVGMIYSTGMEATEFAIRVASVVTGRAKLLGFERSMHGKSITAASLGWHNESWPDAERVTRLPFVSTHAEQDILHSLEQQLADRHYAAVFVEPIQGAGGGYRASADFYRELQRLCRATNTLLVFDEILTGCYRAGSVGVYADVTVEPDLVLLGKAIGNGYPASVVLLRRSIKTCAAMLPGSTFAASPLTCAAISSTLETMTALNIQDRVQVVEKTITEVLCAHSLCAPSRSAAARSAPEVSAQPIRKVTPNAELIVRGSGAFWILELPSPALVEQLVIDLFSQGIAAGYWGNYVRLMPPATIDLDRLQNACEAIARSAAELTCGKKA